MLVFVSLIFVFCIFVFFKRFRKILKEGKIEKVFSWFFGWR